MCKIVKALNGDKFEQMCRWKMLDFTIVSPRHDLAKYADNFGTGDKRLKMTWFKLNGVTYPYSRFVKLDTPIRLEERGIITKYDKETDTYLEVSKPEDKIRLYRKVM